MVKNVLRMGIAILGMSTVSFGGTTVFDFENVTLGGVPAGWKTESMGKPNPLCTFAGANNAAVPGAAATNKVMKVTGYAAGTVYQDCHICWTDAVPFQDGTLEVDVMATGGSIEENYNGIAWRIKDKDNYYAMRYSPKEGLAVFKIVAGKRTNVASVVKAYLADKWYKLKLVQSGATFTIFSDGTQILTGSDADITAGGGVGLFMRSNTSKAEWDNLSITTSGTSIGPRIHRLTKGERNFGEADPSGVINLQGRWMPILKGQNGELPKLDAGVYFVK